MADKKTFAFFPEAAFGPALNSVGIAQAVEKLGHKAVFLSDPGFTQVYRDYGFEAHDVNMSEPMPPEVMAKYWVDFINGHIPNFNKTPYEQIDTYVKDCWNAIVETSIWAEKDLPGVLAKVSSILAGAKISILSVIQPEGHAGESVPLILMLHSAPNAAMRKALEKIAKLPVIKGKPVMFRVESLE